MVFYVLGALSVVTFGLCTAEKLTLPVTTCKRGTPKYHTCLKNALEEAWPRFIEGLPEFGFPSMDPLLFTHISGTFEDNAMYGEGHLDNTIITGMKNMSFGTVKTHLADKVFNLKIDIYASWIMMTGEFQAKGNFLGISVHSQGSTSEPFITNLRINSIFDGLTLSGHVKIFAMCKGYYNASIEDVKTDWDFIGRVVNDTWIIEHFRAIPSFKTLKMYFNDPREGNEYLNDLMSSFVNANWPSIMRIVMPAITESWDNFITDIGNNLFSKVSFSAVFP